VATKHLSQPLHTQPINFHNSRKNCLDHFKNSQQRSSRKPLKIETTDPPFCWDALGFGWVSIGGQACGSTAALDGKSIVWYM
jgi:hypothetical protein